MKAFILALVLILSSCVTTQTQKLNPSTYYKQDICFTYETGKVKTEKIKNFFKRFRRGKYRKTEQVKETATFCGTGVLPYMDEYSLTINSHGKLNYFAITTCHEEDSTENPDKGIFKKNGRIKISYVPTIERGKACPMYISAYNRKQKHGWGIAIFEHPRYQLPATLHCNGYVKPYDGVSICQSREGLIQRIEFAEPVKLVRPIKGAVDRKGDCPVIGEDYQKTYEFKIPNRECYYGFIGKDSKKIHQLLTIGYEDIIVRE